jgi:phage gp37-like protein
MSATLLNREFDFHVLGIEDGIIKVLTDAMGGGGGYVRTITTYGGELDAETLRKVISEIVPNLPMIFVSYGDGEDVLSADVPRVGAEPFFIEHRCTFSVICCTQDARGEMEGRRGVGGKAGVYKMLADVRRHLTGLRFLKPDGEDAVMLNTEPLTPSGVEYVARLTDLTAYAQLFDTRFKYATPDRRTPPVTGMSITPTVEPTEDSRMQAKNLPGVVFID